MWSYIILCATATISSDHRPGASRQSRSSCTANSNDRSRAIRVPLRAHAYMRAPHVADLSGPGGDARASYLSVHAVAWPRARPAHRIAVHVRVVRCRTCRGACACVMHMHARPRSMRAAWQRWQVHVHVCAVTRCACAAAPGWRGVTVHCARAHAHDDALMLG